MGLFSLSKKQAVTAQELIDMFQTVATNHIATQNALASAAESEAGALQAVENSGLAMKNLLHVGQGLSSEQQEQLMRSSLDAHVKKSQADQLNSFTKQQLEELQASAIKKFKGVKLVINRITPTSYPFEQMTWDAKAGEFRHKELPAKQIKGAVEEVLLDKNVLVLLPMGFGGLFGKQDRHYAVPIVDPVTLAPGVSIEIL